MPSKPLWAKGLRILGENEGHHVIFHAEKHGKRPEYLEKVKNVFFPWFPTVHARMDAGVYVVSLYIDIFWKYLFNDSKYLTIPTYAQSDNML